MRLLLTGAAGLVGSAVCEEALRRGFEVLALYRQDPVASRPGLTALQVDLAEPTRLTEALLEFFPDAIINATGVTEAADCDADPALAERLNVALPKHLAMLAHHLSARFIHFSTDNVFDGQNPPYRPTDVPAPLHLYGQLKVMSEREVLAGTKGSATILRLPLVLGNSPSARRSVHERLLHALAAGQTPTCFTDVVRHTVSTRSVAEVAVELCERKLTGLFHWTGEQSHTRHAIAAAILEFFSLPDRLIAAGTCDNPKYPKDLRLNTETLVGKVRARPESFPEQLGDLACPPELREWLAASQMRPVDAVERFVQGRDF